MSLRAEHTTAWILWPSHSDESRISKVEADEPAAPILQDRLCRTQEGDRYRRKGEPRPGHTAE
jgi:hypothetical protein